jgi:hypothetical protein
MIKSLTTHNTLSLSGKWFYLSFECNVTFSRLRRIRRRQGKNTNKILLLTFVACNARNEIVGIEQKAVVAGLIFRRLGWSTQVIAIVDPRSLNRMVHILTF